MKSSIQKIWLLALLMNCWTTAITQTVERVQMVSITVADLDRSIKFFTEVLDFKMTGEFTLRGPTVTQLFGLTEENVSVHVARLNVGLETLELLEFSGTSPGRIIPSDSRSNDVWFQHIAIVVSNMDKAYQRVRLAKVVHVSTAPQTLPNYIPAAEGIVAFYFQDPDGHNLELIQYPKGKGNPRWSSSVGTSDSSIFLGIDHTAIGIEDTDVAYTFWSDILKMKIGGHSENYGPEQEHLNQIFGARLYVTGLHAPIGFGVEFLDYIAPPGGRAYPSESKVTDIWHWHTTLKVRGLEKLYKELLEGGFKLISKGIVKLDDSTKALLVRDQDGHAVLLTE